MKRVIILIAVLFAMQAAAQTTITVPTVTDTDEVGVFYEDNTVTISSTSTVTTNTQANQPPSVVDKQWKQLDPFYKRIISEQRLATNASFDDVKFIFHILGCKNQVEVWLCFMKNGEFFLSNTLPSQAMVPADLAEIGCMFDPINGSVRQTNNPPRIIKRKNQTTNQTTNQTN